jgi:hypothetical protein
MSKRFHIIIQLGTRPRVFSLLLERQLVVGELDNANCGFNETALIAGGGRGVSSIEILEPNLFTFINI